jgi:hypothetical protein
MPQAVISIAALTGFLSTLIYLHALMKLYGVIAVEKPDWINIRGRLSFFYEGFPKFADPNVGAEVVKVAFGAGAKQLKSPIAARYARRIRVSLPLGVAGYLVLIFANALAR